MCVILKHKKRICLFYRHIRFFRLSNLETRDHYTVWNPLNPDEEITAYNVHHYDIKPVDQKTLTEIETYWNLKIKK